MNMQVLALAFLATAAVGGIAWVFLYPLLSGERKAESRRASVSRADVPAAKQAEKSQRSRREQVETTLKDLEARRAQEKSVPLHVRLSQAGLDWTPQKFWIASAVDVIVRGIKAGLPLFESIKVVAADAPEPLRSEFLSIIETQTIGMPLGEACARLYDRMPLPEANFFGIVVSIQQKSGGNLSEALGNLSKVLRDRKKMREKIQAMSMEAKASAGIIGSLPPIVMFLVYLTTPGYISLLWTHPTGQLMLVGCVVWMSVGIMVMKKMINFDF